VSGADRAGERGVALLGAVLLAALATALAVSWLARLDAFGGRTAGMLEELRAAQDVASLEAWAVAVLRRDGRGPAVDHPGEIWALPALAPEVQGGAVAGTLTDLQGRFNLNALVVAGQPNAPAIRLFRALLQRLDLPAVRVEAIVDWIDADNLALPGGGEDALYLRAEPPYRAANGPLASVQELRFVAGVDGAALSRLAPYVTVLPEPAAINVNTAPPLLLELLAGGQSGAALARRRQARPFAGVQDWLAAAPGAPADYAGLVTTASGYFELDSRITASSGTRRYHTQLRRDGQRVSVWARQRIETDA